MTSREELLVILRAIRTVRARWLLIARRKAREIRSYSPGLTSSQAFHQALTSIAVHEEHQKLMNLYGLIGNGTLQYIEALINMPEAKVVPIRKKAA
jgi:hypothetical protein